MAASFWRKQQETVSFQGRISASRVSETVERDQSKHSLAHNSSITGIFAFSELGSAGDRVAKRIRVLSLDGTKSGFHHPPHDAL